MKAQRSAASSQALWKVIKSVFFIIDYIFDAVFLFETHPFMKSLWCCQNTKFVNVKLQLKVEKLKIEFDSGCVNVTIRNRTCHIFLMNLYGESTRGFLKSTIPGLGKTKAFMRCVWGKKHMCKAFLAAQYSRSNGVRAVVLTCLEREKLLKTHPCWHVWSCPGQHKLPLYAFHYHEQTHFQILLGLSVGCRDFVNMREGFHMSAHWVWVCMCVHVSF